MNGCTGAKLIVSTRIHGYLVLLSPVIFIKNKYGHNRFSVLFELLNTVRKNSKNKIEIRFNFDKKGLVNLINI